VDIFRPINLLEINEDKKDIHQNKNQSATYCSLKIMIGRGETPSLFPSCFILTSLLATVIRQLENGDDDREKENVA
jgi:hypothetical protein